MFTPEDNRQTASPACRPAEAFAWSDPVHAHEEHATDPYRFDSESGAPSTPYCAPYMARLLSVMEKIIMIGTEGCICMAVFQPDIGLLTLQINSIRDQTMSNWKCLIGIDGMDADTFDAISELTREDDRFVIHHFQERFGFYHNFERILSLVDSNAAWVALADQDDSWYPDKLELLVGHLAPVSMVMGQARLVRVTNPSLDPAVLGITDRQFFSLGELFLDNVVSGALVVFQASLLEFALPFPTRTDVAYHDHWIGVCAALTGGISVLPNIVQDYVQHDNNVIGEELSVGNTSRFRSLLRRSNTRLGSLQYVVNHRWRWRVTMAETALSRFPQLDSTGMHVLGAFVADRCNLRLMKLSASSVVRGNCSRLRITSLVAAAFFAPVIPKETQIEA